MRSSALFWFALPFLLPQALYVRQTAPRFADAAGPRSGATGSGPTRRLVAFGDSIIAGVGARDLSRALVGRTAAALAEMTRCEVRWSASGHTGATSTDLLRDHLPHLDGDGADLFLVSVGVNDVTRLTFRSRWRDNLARLIDALGERSPDAVIVFTGLPPMGGFPLLPQPLRAAIGHRAAMLDEVAIEALESRSNAIHVPIDFDTSPDKFADDGYHPSEESYVTFGQFVAAAVAPRLADA